MVDEFWIHDAMSGLWDCRVTCRLQTPCTTSGSCLRNYILLSLRERKDREKKKEGGKGKER